MRTVELLKSQKIEIKETLDTIINENSYLSEKLSSLSSVDNVKNLLNMSVIYLTALTDYTLLISAILILKRKEPVCFKIWGKKFNT